MGVERQGWAKLVSESLEKKRKRQSHGEWLPFVFVAMDMGKDELAKLWASLFDRIFCIHYVEYAERKPVIERELNRLGIMDSGVFEWRYTYRNEFERSLAVRLGVNPQALIGPLFIETKRIIAESLYKGYNRILFIEDDAVFLKSLDEVSRILSNMPKDANIVQFDKRTDGIPYRVAKWRELLVTAKINDDFVRADGNTFWGGACYALTRKGIEALDTEMSRRVINSDDCFQAIPWYAISIKSLCLQGEFLNSERALQGAKQNIDSREWTVQNIKRSDYAEMGMASCEGEDVVIPWNRWFDKVYCLHYLPDKHRMPRLNKELSRLGLLGNSLFEMRNMVPQKMEELILADIKCQDAVVCKRLFEVGLGMENIRVMKEALLLGYKRIMILEDDIAFLKDKNKIIEILNAMPAGFGIVQMDKAVAPQYRHLYNEVLANNKINEYFFDSHTVAFTLSTCNVYTREGMEKIVAAMEAKMGIIDTISACIPDEPAVALKNLAVQVIYGDCHNKEFYKKVEEMHSVYKTQGINYGEYAVPEGYDYP